MMFSYAKHVEAYLVSEGDCFEQFAEMSCGIDCPIRNMVDGCRHETVYPDLHLLLILVQAAMRCCQRPAKAERTLRNTTIHSTVTTRARGRPFSAIKR